ncbi:ABC-type phosphate transport system substrate-binding protein [Desulfitispora alkaliphila]|uniref:PstS family phosphate ABC transporter substrate-binding protein n=1 Tax=Desulfitispora alkaliphila TaxID=622674 RepID=UPI003D1E85FF
MDEYYQANKNNHDKDIYTAFVASDEYPFNIIKCSKTGTAYERLINGETDIIFVAEPSSAHVEAIVAKGDKFVLTPLGSEAFVFFTNAENPVESLITKELQRIYSGKITNWRDVGGENRSILPYQRPENSGSQTIMQNWVMRDVEMQEPTQETYAGGMGQIISQVASYRNAKKGSR